MKTHPTRILAAALLALSICFSSPAQTKRAFSPSLHKQPGQKNESQGAAQPGQKPGEKLGEKPSLKLLRSETTERKFDELLAKPGKLRIIVGLSVGYQPEGALASSQAVEEQRALIVRAQDAFMNRLVVYTAGSVKRFETIPFIALEVDAAELKRMRVLAEVVSIEEDVVMKPTLAESTQIIGAVTAWARGFSGSGQTIAILDTGVDKTHSFLTGKVVSEACYSTNNSDASSFCPNGAPESTAVGSGVNCPASVGGCDHGTHVAGIAAGRGSSFSGVARDANVIAIQIFSRFSSASCGGSAPCIRAYTSDIIKGLERVHNLRGSFNIASVNLSLGSGRFFATCDADNPAMTTAISNLRSAGIATVVASGNDGFINAIDSPACVSGAISVGSTDDGSLSTTLDAISSFSNSASFLNLLAPGRWINSSVPGDRFADFSGTSMAAPHVAGAFAVLKSSAPGASVSQILSALTSTGANIVDPRNGISKPRIRVDAALDALNNNACTYAISPLSQSFSAAGGNGSVSVATANGCAWQATSNVAWIIINSGASGSGNGTVSFTAQSNPGTSARTGSATIAGRNFNVTQLGNGTDPCLVRTPINFGQSLNGTLSSGDCQFPDASYVDSYSFNGTGGQQIAINLDSTAFDAYLLLIGPAGDVITFDDDGGGGTNSRIPAGSGFLTLPATGTYTIAANSFRAGETGGYNLRLTMQTNTGGGNTVTLVSGVTVGGSIQAASGGFGVLSTTQYSIEVPNGAGQLSIVLDGGQDVDLFARFGRRIELANGNVSADFRAESLGGHEVIAINQFSTPQLQSGIYYLAVANYGTAASFSITATVGQPPAGTPVELSLDDGSFESSLVINQFGTSYAVNRITPPSYPATLSAVKITFLSRNGPRIGDFFSLMAGSNPDGDSDINGTQFQQVTARVQAFDQLVTYSVPQVTIGSGDFVIGMRMTAGTGVFPFAYDTTPPSRQRSYFSTNGVSFTIIDTFGTEFRGNFAFRAIVSVPQNCNYSIAPTNQNFDASGGSGTVNVTAPQGCAWTAASSSSFITITSGTSGSGNSAVGFSVAANTGASQRSGTMTIAGQSFTVTQSAGGNCSYSLSSTFRSFPVGGGSNSVSVNTTSGCGWTAVSNDNWLTITSGASGSGNGAIGYSVAANPNASPRTGTMTIAGQTFRVFQSGCVSLGSSSRYFETGGGTGSLTVNAAGGCTWTAVSNAAWLTLTGATSGNGNGVIAYSVAANPGSAARGATINVSGNFFYVEQRGNGSACVSTPIAFGQTVNGSLSAGDCASPSRGIFGAYYADRYTFSGTSGQRISISQTSAAIDSYIFLIGPDGTILAIDDEGGGAPNSRIPFSTGLLRLPVTGVYTIESTSYFAGETGNYTLGLNTTCVGLSPVSQTFTSNGGNASLAVAAAGGCAWNATSNANWLTVNSGGGSGTGTINYSVAPNPTGGPRSAMMAVAGDSFAVSQSSSSLTLSTDDGTFEISLGYGGGTGYYVNRLTPTSYPATLSAVSIYLTAGNIQAGDQMTVLAGINPSGASDINNVALQGVTATVQAVGQFNVFNIPALTISSGDFVVGFRSAAAFPCGYDRTLPWLQRSYASRNGLDFQRLEDGNLGIRGLMAQAPAVAGTGLLGEYFNNDNFTDLKLTRADPVVNFDWDVSAPDARLDPDTFSVRWTGQVQAIESGNYTFAIRSDDGVRLWVNNQLVIDNFTSHAEVEDRSAPITLTAGQRVNIKLEYFEGGGGAVAKLLWIRPGQNSPDVIPQSQLNSTSASACTFTLGPPNQSFSASANIGGVSVFAQSGCTWTAASNDGWITITANPSGTGNGVVGYAVSANNTGQARTGTMTIAGQSFIVTQSACTFALSPASQSFGAGLGTGGFSITTLTGCAWAATSNDPWITITSASSGSGLGSLAYNVAANSGPARTGTISVGGQTFTVTQAGQSCSYAISPTSQNVDASGGNGSASVTAGSGCNWTAVSNAAFITINSGANGSGNGTVNFAVAANAGANSRSGTMTIAGQTFTVTQAGTVATSRVVRAGQVSGAPGSTVSVPIELLAQGDENALGFSITFDPAILSNPQATPGGDANSASLNTNAGQAAQGRFGVAVSLPSGQRFSTGTRQVVNVSFALSANANASSTPIGFGDQPIAREISDTSANALSANYVAGAVIIAQGYEADVAPRPNGNGSLTVTDWVQVGRFVAGADTPNPGSEFQRADVAPRATAGDGRLTITDWVQAGRYAAGLDPLAAAGGPTSAAAAMSEEPLMAETADGQLAARTLRIAQVSFERGQNGVLIVELDAQGNENALGFSLGFDPAQMRFVSAALANGAAGATFNLNTNQAANGRLGIAIALPAGQTFVAGVRQLLTITFAASASGNPAATTVSFLDQPVTREVSDSNANALSTAYAGSAVQLTRTVASVSAASFLGQSLAAESIVAAFGSGLATGVVVAASLPLPTSLLGTVVKVRDSAGTERAAPLFFVAPSQINYQIPPGTALGTAQVTITAGDGLSSNGQMQIAAVAPGLISANANGQGVVTAVALRVKADGTQTYESVARFDAAANTFVAVPLDLGPSTDQVFLIVFGTGIRGRGSLNTVTARLGGTDVPVLYAGAQGGFVGLDQINLGPIPRSLIGRGEIEIGVTAEGRVANTVRINIR